MEEGPAIKLFFLFLVFVFVFFFHMWRLTWQKEEDILGIKK